MNVYIIEVKATWPIDSWALLKGIERDLVYDALVKTKGNRTHAAALLKIKRTCLIQKMCRFDLMKIDFSKK